MISTARTFTVGFGTLAIIFCGGLIGCTTPQSITIETTPSGAAISIDDEYIGKSPIVFDITNTNDFNRLRIVAEKQSFESALKTIKKKRTGLFAERVFMKLDPTMTAAAIKAALSSGEQQQQTTIQGPTIVMPSGASVVPPAQ